LLFALSFVLGYQVMLKIFTHEGHSQKQLDSLTVYMILGTVIGARLGHCLFYEPAYYLSHPIEILKVWNGGLASHGAALGILLSLYLFAKKNKNTDYSWLLDRVVIVVALAGFFIRLGNFFNSEIIGLPTDLPWAVIFHRIDELPRHPSQLYESITYLGIFIVLWFRYKKWQEKTPKYAIFSLFLILIFTARFLIEFTKENQSLFENGMMLNMGQLLSLPLIVLGIVLFVKSRKEQHKQNPA
jgi:prolipoprotein diacylglyceryl transferase